jgi:hypothetical protein
VQLGNIQAWREGQSHATCYVSEDGMRWEEILPATSVLSTPSPQAGEAIVKIAHAIW